jgi:hypothetical protein
VRDKRDGDGEHDAAAAAKTATARLTRLLATLAGLHARVILDQVKESLRDSARIIGGMAARLERVEPHGVVSIRGQARVLRAVATQLTDMAAELTATGRLVGEASPGPAPAVDDERIEITDEMLDELFRSERDKRRSSAGDEDFGLF